MLLRSPQLKNSLPLSGNIEGRQATGRSLPTPLFLFLGIMVIAPSASYAQEAGHRNQPESSAPTSRVAKTQQDGRAPTIQLPQAGTPPLPSPTPQPPIVTPNPIELSSAAPASNASASDAEVIDEGDVVRINSNLVIVPASVVDSRGRAITDLKVEDFELRVDGQVKPIRDLSRAETPVSIALLFDNSESLSAARVLEKQAATRFFRNVVRPIDQAAIFSNSTVPTLEQPLTNDVQKLVRTIERFGNPDGATALFDTLARAADYLHPLVGRKIIVLVSDGADTISDLSFEAALQRVLRADCQIYVVQTRQVEDPNLRDPVAERWLEKLSQQTGGAVYVPQSVEDLDAAFTQISLDLSQQYLLSYYPQDERPDKYFRFISLRVKTRPNLRVRTRRGFYPDAAQNQAATLSGNTMTSGVSGASTRSDLATIAGKKPVATIDVDASVTRKEQLAAQGSVLPSTTDQGINRNHRIGPVRPEEEQALSQEAASSLKTAPTSTVNKPIPAPTPAPAPQPKAASPLTPTIMPAYNPPARTVNKRRNTSAPAPATNHEKGGRRGVPSPDTVQPRAVAAETKRSAQAVSGSWLVICGSFARTQHEQAQEKLMYLREKGYDARIVDTNQYPNLRKDLWAVVTSSSSREQAESLRRRTLSEGIRGCYVKSGW